ncbi:MAG TPA: TrgA family protein [Aliiroseovarius sp.]|nr:TrgA family protein [Aliiroseovarius sp.]
MPTTARLFGALFFAALGWYCADLFKPLLPEGTAVGLFSPTAAGFGALVGWTFTGKRADLAQSGGLGIGLTSAFLLVFWVLLTFSAYKMLQNSLRKLYGGPVEALQDMFSLGVEYLQLAVQSPQLIGALLVGGLVGGWLTEQIARRWS